MPKQPETQPVTRSRRRGDRRRRVRRRRAIVSLSVVVGLIVGIAGAAAFVVHDVVGGNVTTIADSEAFPSGDRPTATSGVQNILLLGSDSRATGAEATRSSQRADTMMLVNISADRRHVSVMSLLRDLRVPVRGHGETKINASFAHGGTALAVQTVEDLLGARIDHVAVIDFAGLSAMTTALGGVVVDNPQAFTASRGDDRYFAAGPLTLEGDRALTFARERYAFATADFHRVTNQQLLLRGIISRALSRDVLADPASLVEFARQTSKHVTVDAGFTVPAMASLGYGLRGADLSAFEFFTLPTAGTGMVDGQSVVLVDAEATAEVRAALRGDRLAAYAAGLGAAR